MNRILVTLTLNLGPVAASRQSAANCSSGNGGALPRRRYAKVQGFNARSGLRAILTLLASLQLVSGQEQLPRREALKYAFYVSADLKALQATPIATDVDVKHAVGVRDGDYAALVLPESKLAPEALAKPGEPVVPLGQLWLYKLTLMREGEAVPASSLRIVSIETEGEPARAVQCALGVKGNGAGGLDLLVYGKDKTPLLKLALKKRESQLASPIAISAERADDAGLVTLKILGRYETVLKVTELQE